MSLATPAFVERDARRARLADLAPRKAVQRPTNEQSSVPVSVARVAAIQRSSVEQIVLPTAHAELLAAAEDVFERNFDEKVVWAERDESRYRRAAFDLREFVIGAAEDNVLTSHDQRIISACYERYFAQDKKPDVA
jgi:hypothetical protein